jgi:hypothetical protein
MIDVRFLCAQGMAWWVDQVIHLSVNQRKCQHCSPKAGFRNSKTLMQAAEVSCAFSYIQCMFYQIEMHGSNLQQEQRAVVACCTAVHDNFSCGMCRVRERPIPMQVLEMRYITVSK